MASLVIKVKYEETLRRFNVAVSGDRRLDLSMEGLRLKISSLFNLPADFRLTYEDEDDDLVTLVDDDDLHDLVRQGLDPVRITVYLNSDRGAQSSSAPSSGSVAQRTPSLQNVQPNIYPNVAEVLSSVQEPLSRILLNLRSSTPNSQQSHHPDAVKIMKSVQEPLAQALSKLSLDMSSKAASTSPILADLFDGLSKMGQLCVNAALSDSGNTSISSNVKGGNDSKPNSDGRKQKCSVNEGIKNDDIDTAIRTQPAAKSTQAIGVSVRSPLCASVKESSRDAAEKSRGFQSYCEPIPLDKCSFAGTPLTPDQICKQIHLSNRSFHKADSVGSVFHKSVRCDGCGVLPITGPRFKSKVKYDFDLCSICFSRMGNDVDYTRIDFPLAYRHPWSFNSPDAKSSCPYMKRPNAPEHLSSRFDSRFIMDVNVMDGTTMAPSTPFTKIWRMRNNGTVPWNRGLKLLWVGGDRFSPSDSVEIRVPLTGVDVASELDISVNFITPDLPGRYISYWRMAKPSGHMFGQRVWVQIQVDSSLDLTRESSPMLNLNLPPDSNDTAFPHAYNVKAEPGLSFEVGESSALPILEQDYSNFPINNDLLVANDVAYPSYAAPSSSFPQAASTDRPVSPVAPSSVSYPEVDANTYCVPEASAPRASYPTIDGNRNLDDNSNYKLVSEKTKFKKPGVEEKLLKELEQMGSKQTALNKEVLRMNEYDLERSVDGLCDVSEWDPILKELREMGFKDKELNKKLLVKNNGSITRVVMDLIADK